jgi:hypothetical protein
VDDEFDDDSISLIQHTCAGTLKRPCVLPCRRV